MLYATAQQIEDYIVYVLNATTDGYGTAITDAKRKPNPGDADNNPITHARRFNSARVLKAIASNPKHGNFGDLMTLVDAEHNSFLTYDGEVGIPRIVPFEGATAREGEEATPDQIDSWRLDAEYAAEEGAFSAYTGALDGVAIPHNLADANGRPSPISCRYSIIAAYFKFTGFSAQIPMIRIDDDMIDNKIPFDLAPTVIKLSIPMSVKEGDNLYQIAPMYGALGEGELIRIAGGEMKAQPVPMPNIVTAQKTVI